MFNGLIIAINLHVKCAEEQVCHVEISHLKQKATISKSFVSSRLFLFGR